MFQHRPALYVGVASILLSAPGVFAQTASRLAVGASVTTRVATSEESGSGAAINFEWRIGHAIPGWGPQLSLFNWFGPVVHRRIGGGTIDPGHIRIRPLLAGYGYTWVRRRTAITADVVAGYTLNSFRIDSAALAEYERLLGASGIESEATNAWAVKPEVQAWYDINNRFGLKLN